MIKYRPEIDGLRTIAVLPVIIFHLGYSFVSAGYYGVDVFFVISGYLITKILTEKIATQTFSMYDFWIRRVKRLLPLLLTVVITVLLVVPRLVFRPYVKAIVQDVYPAIFSYSNFHALFDFGDYWGSAAEKSFFLHTWSLSVEEQFYLIYPVILLISYKAFRSFLVPIIGLLALSMFVFFYKVGHHREFAFFMLPARIWELCAGGLVSVLSLKLSGVSSKLRPVLSIAGLLLITVTYFIGERVIGYSVVFPVLGSCLIIGFCSQGDYVGKVLSSSLFTFIGNLSYSLYLWHWPVIVLFRDLDYRFHSLNPHVVNCLIVLLTFALSYLSYLFIENKTRNFRHTPKLVLASIVLVFGISKLYKPHRFNIHYQSAFAKLKYYVNYYDMSPRQPKPVSALAYNVEFPARPPRFEHAYRESGFIKKINNADPEVVLIGDSHGVMWAKVVDEICDSLKLSRSFYVSNASKPFVNIHNRNDQMANNFFTKQQRIDYANSLLNNLVSWHPKLVIIACRWETAIINEDQAKEQFIEMLDFLNKHSIKVLLINQPPRFEFMGNDNASQYFTYLGFHPQKAYNFVDNQADDYIRYSNSFLSKLSSPFKNVSMYDCYSNMKKGSSTYLSKGDTIFYFDDDHLSYYGALFNKNALKNALMVSMHR